jgi:hypothetical protein
MIKKTKITLSAKELEMVCNTDWILTKQAIIKKVYELFGEFSESIQQQASRKLVGDIWTKSPKISRGERYQNLPYVMLDYPRYFAKNETTAIRTFFWWGNFCSINLHLFGHSKTVAVPILIEQFSYLQQNDFSICVNNTPWEHYFEEDNYMLVKKISMEKFIAILEKEPFVKIAKKIPLHQWEQIFPFLNQSFNELLQFIPIMHQAYETGLLPGTPIIDSGL